MNSYDAHARKCDALVEALSAARQDGAELRLGKPTSNLFRHRNGDCRKLDVRAFNGVLSVDADQRTADVEGMAPYDAVAAATMREGLVPAVVPQLKSITVGGAVAGIGIESSSYLFGLVHETVEDMDVLLADGRVITCSRTQNEDLFYGFANSYGTLGYVLRLRIRLIPARPYVHLRHWRHSRAATFFAQLTGLCRKPEVNYIDGVVFSGNEMYITTGEFCAEAPETSDYRWMNIYYRSIRERREDWLTASDYIWRWDTDWFWCSKNLYAQNRAVRLVTGPRLLNSRTYQKVMRLAQRLHPNGTGESVIQDVDIPMDRAGEFLEFLLNEIGITPIWVCPFRVHERYDLYALEPGVIHVNFGFWDIVPSTFEAGHFNRMVERRLVELGGKKGLYSSVWFDRETFRRVYNGARYDQLKAKYDPRGRWPDLYEKCAAQAAAR